VSQKDREIERLKESLLATVEYHMASVRYHTAVAKQELDNAEEILRIIKTPGTQLVFNLPEPDTL
jgi:hypothetical protein